jgi:hypothetical protein
MNYKLRKLIMIAMACSFAAGSTTEAGGSSSMGSVSLGGAALTDNARLSVGRSADFGFNIYLIIFIDGTRVATLGTNERYEGIVRPGHHVLSIATTPNPYGHTVFTPRNVTMKRGQIYTFTAVWGESDRATLETPDEVIGRTTRNVI